LKKVGEVKILYMVEKEKGQENLPFLLMIIKLVVYFR